MVFTQEPDETPMVTKDLGDGQPTQCCIEDDGPTTQEPETGSPVPTFIIPRSFPKCYKQGMMPHPTDKHKYVVCEYIAVGPDKGWSIHIIDCVPGTRWNQPTQNCIQDDEPTTHSPTTQPPVTPSPTTAAPVTPSPTTQSHVTSTEGATTDAGVTFMVGTHPIRCYKNVYISHPTDRHKYIFCEYVAEGSRKGW